MIIAGDFNDWRRKADRALTDELGVYEVFEEVKGRPARTFPSVMPVFRLDRIYARGLDVIDARVHYAFPSAACPITPRSPRRSRYRQASHRPARPHDPLHAGQPRSTLLRSGGEFFPGAAAAIDGAEREIWLETYIFADDATGRRVADALCAPRRAASRCACWSTAGAPGTI